MFFLYNLSKRLQENIFVHKANMKVTITLELTFKEYTICVIKYVVMSQIFWYESLVHLAEEWYKFIRWDVAGGVWKNFLCMSGRQTAPLGVNQDRKQRFRKRNNTLKLC